LEKPNFYRKNERNWKKTMNSIWSDPEKAQKIRECAAKAFFGKNHKEESKRIIGIKNSISQKSDKNSQFGTCWIFNELLKKNKKISKIDIDVWRSIGWKSGRKMKF
jgi:hypothetical protein